MANCGDISLEVKENRGRAALIRLRKRLSM